MKKKVCKACKSSDTVTTGLPGGGCTVTCQQCGKSTVLDAQGRELLEG